jgi:enoyl-CoA hydratase
VEVWPDLSPRVLGATLRVVGLVDRLPGGARLLDNRQTGGLLATRRLHQVYLAMNRMDKVFVAAINGTAAGGGCELALACDMVLAAEHAAFGLPEASVGLVPGFGVLRAPSVLGRHTAKFMVLAGERISAQRACELGLVQQVLPAAELVPAALRLGAKIAERAPLAVEVGKRMVNRGVDRGEAGYGVEAVTMLYATRDAAEGIRAFTERREPRFEGR